MLVFFAGFDLLLSNDVNQQLAGAVSHAVLAPRPFVLVKYPVLALLMAKHAQAVSLLVAVNDLESADVL